MGAGCHPWAAVAVVAGGGSHTSWFTDDGEGHLSPWWWSCVSGFVIMGTRCDSWVGHSLPSMGWHCGHSSLFVLVVSRGVHVVDGGGHLWAVVE